MGRINRVAALATTAAMGAATLALASGSGRGSAQVDPGSRAIEYLQTQQSAANGSIPRGRAPMRSASSTRSGRPPPAMTPRRCVTAPGRR